MPVTYNWAINQMDCYPKYEGQNDVVFTVHWTLDGTDGKFSSGVYGSVAVPLAKGAPFTPYASLTKDQVIGWVKNALGAKQVVAYENNVAKEVAAQASPPVATPPLPWNA